MAVAVAEKPVVQLAAERDPFVILGACTQAARLAGWTKAERDAVLARLWDGDFADLRPVAAEHFDVR